ncbi:MAG: isoaspartyl peptidase/L-asparaginase [Cyclobacteriaceae bacterium]|nr:isoaspartyl peptidase/L-asparaginase [Cyclobacteriaceae bacterium]MCH8515070.1 isoaspartyl peptidase/L-asparaginase [Cyclobacteriaceae bacterium]
MKNIAFVTVLFTASIFSFDLFSQSPKLVIHGGAGTIKKEYMTDEQEKEYRSVLEEALNVGYELLELGEDAESAVIAAIMVMENSPLFNAGKGSVLTATGIVEMDAAIMNGKTGQAGAIAGVRRIKNPITAAQKVKDESQHVMMIGNGAEIFAGEKGVELVDPDYFLTDKRKQQLERIKDSEKLELDHSGDRGFIEEFHMDDKKHGTVGAVALDKAGNIVAGTSTGGMTNKKYGRVGDVPIIGSGTFADNASCAVSATGHGEYFIRNVVAYDIAALMLYAGKSLQEAADEVVMKKLVDKGGSGGIIAIDAQGNIAMPFNSEGMYRGFIEKKGAAKTFIFKDE